MFARFIVAAAFLLTGCSAMSRETVVRHTDILPCPSMPVPDSCELRKPSLVEFQGLTVRQGYGVIATWAINLGRCQNEVVLWRTAYRECYDG